MKRPGRSSRSTDPSVPEMSPLVLHVLLLAAAAAVITWAGTRLARLADQLANRTGLGESLTGTAFLGITTSLPGLAASMFAAWQGRPALAISNALGGIALQTVFLAVADIAYRKSNLEHAAASVPNMVQATLLLMLLTLALLGLSGPEVTVGHVHGATPLIFVAAAGGTYLAWRARSHPMWRPRETSETVQDRPEPGRPGPSLFTLVLSFAGVAGLVLVAGAVVAHAAGEIADATGISETVAGGLLSGLATSLPELVTTVAAVRRGALTLAVSDIVGGNFFDVLFVAAADLVYLQGSIFHAEGVGWREQFFTTLAILLNVVLLLGLLYRQRDGPGRIGFESVAVLCLYLAGLGVLVFAA